MKDDQFDKALLKFKKVVEQKEKASAHKKRIAKNFLKSKKEILSAITSKTSRTSKK